MDRDYVYSLVPVGAVALLLFFSAVLHGRNARGLAAYCLAVASWTGALLLAAVPSTAWLGQRLVAAGGFVVAGFLHAAYSLVGAGSRALLAAAYAVAAVLAVAHFFHPGWIHDPVALRAGPLFWPSMALALAAATIPTAWLVRVAPRDVASRRELRWLLFGGLLGYAGAAIHAILLAHGRVHPAGMLVVLASLFVVANVVRWRQRLSAHRLLERSLAYSAVTAMVSAAVLFGLLVLVEGERVTQAGAGALFLLAMGAAAFEPLRRHVVDRVAARLLGRSRPEDLERELVRQEQRADQASRLAEIGALTSAVAHEVRGPLGVMSAQLRVLERSGADPETLASTREQLARVERFVDDMLRYGRPRLLEIRKVDLVSLAQLGVSTARQGLGDRAPKVRVDLDGSPPELLVEVDPAQVLQVAVVLAENAMLAIDDGSELTLRFRLEERSGVVRWEVDDDGPGIPEEILPRVFEPFMTGRKREGLRQGTGLGLAIAKGIVQRHRGTIAAGRSELGGARFVIEIPTRPSTDEESEAPR